MLWSISRSLGFGSVVILVPVQRGPRYPTSEVACSVVCFNPVTVPKNEVNFLRGGISDV